MSDEDQDKADKEREWRDDAMYNTTSPEDAVERIIEHELHNHADDIGSAVSSAVSDTDTQTVAEAAGVADPGERTT